MIKPTYFTDKEKSPDKKENNEIMKNRNNIIHHNFFKSIALTKLLKDNVRI